MCSILSRLARFEMLENNVLHNMFSKFLISLCGIPVDKSIFELKFLKGVRAKCYKPQVFVEEYKASLSS